MLLTCTDRTMSLRILLGVGVPKPTSTMMATCSCPGGMKSIARSLKIIGWVFKSDSKGSLQHVDQVPNLSWTGFGVLSAWPHVQYRSSVEIKSAEDAAWV